MFEKTSEFDIDHLTVDFKQAYDSIKREELVKALVKVRYTKKLVRLTSMTLTGSISKVRVQGILSNKFVVKYDLRQETPLSSLTLEIIIRAIRTNPGETYTQDYPNTAYVDDVMLSARSLAVYSS